MEKTVEENRQKRKTISFSLPDISELEIKEVIDTLCSGWITTGERVKKLEVQLAKFCNTNKMVCLNSATAAEELNLRILGIGPGDEVIVPAFTYTATASAAIHVGAKVIFADSQKDSFEMDYSILEDLITKKTKAIIPVDYAGVMCNYDKLYQVINCKKGSFCPKNEIQETIGRVAIVADSAHSLGASRNGKKAGEVADFTSFSFHAVKNFTTAEGGASTWRTNIGIDDEILYKQFQLLSLHGQTKDALSKNQLGTWEYDIVGPWFKCNMTDIMAAIGLKQLERYLGLLERRKEIIGCYDRVCDKLGIFHINHYSSDFSSSGHLYPVRIFNINENQRNEIIIKMAKRGISTNVHYKPLPMMTAYKTLGWDIRDFPNAYDYYHNLITLPLHTLLTDDDIAYILKNLEEIIREYV